MKATDPVDPTFNESCPHRDDDYDPGDGYFHPPKELVLNQTTYPSPLHYADFVGSSSTEWRLLDELRRVAALPSPNLPSPNGPPLPDPTDPKTPPLDPSQPHPRWDERTPLRTLAEATKELATSIASHGSDLQSLPKTQAKVDLAVTGRLAYETLAAMHLATPQDVITAMGFGDVPPDGPVAQAAQQVVARAQRVAWAIRGNPQWRALLRPQLGWIAVSGEDDAPHRPCNVPSLPAPQYDLKVSLGRRTFTTRVAIANFPYPSSPVGDVTWVDPPTFLPPDDPPTVAADADFIFLYMAGDASRIEEAVDLIPALFTVAAARGVKISVIAFDMMGWGYSSRRFIDYNPTRQEQVGRFDQGFQGMFGQDSYPTYIPGLQFCEDFVVALLETLHQQPPYIDLSRVIPIGGSLGGNLALRLGRRTDLSWLKAVCGWSPGSVWPSKATNPTVGATKTDGVALGTGIGAVAGGVIGFFFGIFGAIQGAILGGAAGGLIGDAVGGAAGTAVGNAIDQSAISNCDTAMNTPEDLSQRAQHFVGVFDKDTYDFGPIHVVPPQATMWYRAEWKPCKAISMVKDRLDRREVYDATFRRWHWRISKEQLMYSHWDLDPATGKPRYLRNKIPMLLAAGEQDDYQFLNIQYAAIYSFTRKLADVIPAAGISLFLHETGHSIHNERPHQLASAIFDLLAQQYRDPVLAMAWKGVEYDQRLWWARAFDGTSWTVPQFHQTGPGPDGSDLMSSEGPALAVFHGRLYMAWKGVAGDQRLWWASSADGLTWDGPHYHQTNSKDPTQSDLMSSEGPALAVFHGRLYMAWKGVAGDQRLWWASTDFSTLPDGNVNWDGPHAHPIDITFSPNDSEHFNSSEGPALAVFHGRLYMAWKGVAGDQRLWWASSADGVNWSTPQSRGDLNTNQHPALVPFEVMF